MIYGPLLEASPLRLPPSRNTNPFSSSIAGHAVEMWGWWGRKKRERERLEQLRRDRGKLAVAIVTLDRKRHDVEELMKRMLIERANLPVEDRRA